VTEPSPARGPIPLATARRAESLRQLGLLSAGVAHDMRNVLNGLSLRIQVLQGTGGIAPDVAASLAQMRRDISLGAQLLGRVRELGRCETSIGMERVELDHVLADACQLARFHSPSGSPTTTEIVRDGSSPVVFGQRSEMVSAILNLLLNAVDASPGGGKITARTGSDRGTSFIEVEDEGPGIPPDVQARMFEPYFTTKGNDGTGLGLASVAECARRFRGEVRVTTGLHGTTIALVLPTASSERSTSDEAR
jgi:signal transduction histidine kinase